MIRNPVFALFISLIMIFTAHSSFAQNKGIISEGVSSVSFNEALRNAQRSAVEQGAGTFIHSQTEVENFTVQKDKIFAKTEGYITKYDVVEKKEENGIYTIKINANVSLDKVKTDLVALKILLESMERPKLIVLIEESYSGLSAEGMKPAQEGMRLAETEMISALQEKGFEIVDKEQIAAAKQQDQAKQILAGNDKAAKSLGMMFGAQYMIIGKAAVDDSGEAMTGSGLRSMHASLQLKILQCQSGLNLGSVVKQSAAAHINKLAGATEALKKASKLAVNTYIADKIMDSFQNFLNNGLPIKVHVTGVASFTQSQEIIALFESLQNIASCKKEGWNKASSLLVLDLIYKGMSEDLAKLVDQKTVGKAKLFVEDVGPEKLNLSLQL